MVVTAAAEVLAEVAVGAVMGVVAAAVAVVAVAAAVAVAAVVAGAARAMPVLAILPVGETNHSIVSEVPTMKANRVPVRLGWMTSFCLVFVVLAGCAERNAPMTRNFTRTVQVEGQDVLQIDCQYVGKSPADPKSYQSPHDYRSIDTDFYRLSFTNLTDQEIEIAGISYHMEKGPNKGRSKATPETIKRTWGTTTIGPHKTISHPNGFVWSNGRQNRLIKTYRFRTQDSNGSPRTFQEDVGLWYSR